jgi:hypothetical protein
MEESIERGPGAWVVPLAGALVITCAVVVIYAKSSTAYFFNDDFHWLVQTQEFEPANMLDLSRYDHFYRPVIELYFQAGLALFGCDAVPFHVASVVLHLLTTLVLFFFARALAGSAAFGFLSAALFAVQPGFTETVTWIGAIVDLLPVLWYLLALWMHLLFLQRGEGRHYAGALLVFVLCHLTHESSATLLPMMVALDFTFAAEGTVRARLAALSRRAARYVPFAVMLAGYLALAYVVNTRSYLVREGHYAFGWHAIPNVAHYIISLYVGRRALVDYVLVCVAIGALLWWGSPRRRFLVLWIFVTLAPVSFFTWGNAPRYLYLPATGVAMLMADLLLASRAVAARRVAPRTAGAVTALVAVALAARFGVFAKKGADSFPKRTQAYERFVAEVRRSGAGAAPGATVYVDRRFAEGVPEVYREPAARIGLCLPDIRLQLR